MTSLTLYGTETASTLTTACTLVTITTGGVSANKTTKVAKIQGSGELFSLGSTATWPGTTIPAAAGVHGFLYDSTALYKQIFAEGTWTVKLNLNWSASYTTMASTITARLWKRTTGGVYTQIGTALTLAGPGASTTAQTLYTLSGTLPATTFYTGEQLYLDVWLTATSTGGTTSITMALWASSSATGGVAGQVEIDTPAYSPIPTYGTYKSVVLGDSPIRYYRLNEPSGSSAIDSGSQAQNGTIVNGGTGVTLAQTGLIRNDPDTSMLFTTASSGYITLPTTSLPTGAGAWSMEAWVKMPNPLPTTTSPCVMGFGTAATNQFAEIRYHGSAAAFEYVDWTTTVIADTVLSVAAGGVYHLVATYDGTTAKFYINGALYGSVAKTFNIVAGLARIGDDSSSVYWSGNIDEVAFYSTALTSTQVVAHYNSGIVTNRWVGTSAALLLTKSRTVTTAGSLAAGSPTRTVTSAGALLATKSRTVTAAGALLLTKTRTVVTSASLSGGHRTVTAAGALLATKSRTVTTSASLSGGHRTVTASGSLRATKSRTVTATASLSGGHRTVTTTGAMLLIRTRTALAVGALLLTKTRTAGVTASLSGGHRTVGVVGALLLTKTRTAGVTASLSGGHRTVGVVGALLLTKTRTAGVTASLSGGHRTVGVVGALLLTKTRTAGVTASLSGGHRTVGTTGALLKTASRTVTAAASASGGHRTVPASAALLQRSKRMVVSTASLSAAGTNMRTIPTAGATLFTTSCTVVSTGAILSTKARTVPSLGTLLLTKSRTILTATSLAGGHRTVGGTASLLLMESRAVTAAAVILQTKARTVTSLASLSGGHRTVTTSGALLLQERRTVIAIGTFLVEQSISVPAAAALTLGNIVPCSVVLSLIGSRVVLCSASLLAYNAAVFVRSGTASLSVHSGVASLAVRSGTAAVYVRSGKASVLIDDG